MVINQLNRSKLIDLKLFRNFVIMSISGGSKDDTQVENFSNCDLNNITTPLNIKILEQILVDTKYDVGETKFLVGGFSQGFDIGYKGPVKRQSRSKNIPFTVGNKVELWSKIMKEVKAKRMAGPYDEIPFADYIQSPVGLVPNAGNKTRMIFHLLFNFGEGEESLNVCTPKEIRTVHYNDLDHAIKCCMKLSHQKPGKPIFLGKTDLSNAFRVLLLRLAVFAG